MNKKQFKKVRPEDFDVEMLLAAAREGRLYVDDSRKEVSKEDVINKVRAYVSRIKRFATPRFYASVDGLWDEILSCSDFVAILIPGSKARKCRDFDKYSVMRIIGVLREKGVYEQYSDRKFDAQLEPSYADSPYRRYLGMGLEQHSLLVEIRRIVAECEL